MMATFSLTISALVTVSLGNGKTLQIGFVLTVFLIVSNAKMEKAVIYVKQAISGLRRLLPDLSDLHVGRPHK